VSEEEAAKARDAMLREMAKHRGFRLVKSRRRKPGGDFGRFGLIDADTGQDCFGIGKHGLEASAEEIEAYLRAGAKSDWKRSLGTAGPRAGRRVEAARPKPRPAPKAKAPPPGPEPEPPRLEIREAEAADSKAIGALLGVERVGAALKRMIAAGEAPLVAVQGEVVGCAAFHVVPMLKHAPIGRITLLLVAPDRRREGIGRALIEAAATALERRGCGTIEAAGGMEVGDSQPFFRKAGFNRAGYRYVKQTNA
jgi:GNAT superfamily N-acetyltransferase